MMSIAHLVAQRSTCSRLQVGCVLTDLEHQQIWVGYNGSWKGGPNTCLRNEPGNCGDVHAEENAVIKAPQGPKVAYVTTLPCERCAVLLINSGVTQVHYAELYRTVDGLIIFNRAGIPAIMDLCE